MTTNTQTQEIPSFLTDEDCIVFNDIKYPLHKIGQILTRDRKQQEYKRKAYQKWRQTDKGKAASRKASKNYYHKNKVVPDIKDETPEIIENPQEK
tara:strand:+ start:3320 stop:3604 length:285 start_codon:yes stop_codon:yes gene_type:complete